MCVLFTNVHTRPSVTSDILGSEPCLSTTEFAGGCCPLVSIGHGAVQTDLSFRKVTVDEMDYSSPNYDHTTFSIVFCVW